ncbi:hypothetical protein [Spiroplasma ixodetis]|uniref:hypothetical protein n=1 Tax=Spiroplasma ixodetis TaxID=2141 RepID=UPI002492244B|nr:hypothetical protein [Spiroplasma ixodetis]
MKTWIKTNLSKITLALALTGATTGTIGLIMGGCLPMKIVKIYHFIIMTVRKLLVVKEQLYGHIKVEIIIK